MQAELANVWNPVGYIPGGKVKKAMDALDKQEIKTVKFKTIECFLITHLPGFFNFSIHSGISHPELFITLAILNDKTTLQLISQCTWARQK